MNQYLFFDSASTTKCCASVVEELQTFAAENYGNPSSTHALGLQAARAIRDARNYFAQLFKVDPEQVIFTGSGSEANNLAIYGRALAVLAKHRSSPREIQVVVSGIEHPSVRKTAESIRDLGIHPEFVPVSVAGEVDWGALENLLARTDRETAIVSFQQVNNILGTLLPIEALAKRVKEKFPRIIFHCDSVQAFGKTPVPNSFSAVDLVSLSAHKIHGPKGIGALIVLNKKLLRSELLRPLIWGGDQEHGLRSGTQNAGLVAGFHVAAQEAIREQKKRFEIISALHLQLRRELLERGLLNESGVANKPIRWNSFEFSPGSSNTIPHIINLSVPGLPSGPMAKLLEERGCLVSVGSACSARRPEPDPVLAAIGFSMEVQTSALRISFSHLLSNEDVTRLAEALQESIAVAGKLLGTKRF